MMDPKLKTHALVSLELARAAYTVSQTNGAVFPPGYEYLGLITADQGLSVAAHPKLRAYADHGQFGCGLVKDNKLTLAFRGTGNDVEWLTDAHFLPTDFDIWAGTGRVESGFYSVYKACRGSIADLLKRSGCSTIEVTGHSLGSVLATYCAADLGHMMSITIAPSVVFESPRAGHGDFRDWFDKNIPDFTRIVNYLDVVTDLPHFIVGYRDVKRYQAQLVHSGGLLEFRYRHGLDAVAKGLQSA